MNRREVPTISDSFFNLCFPYILFKVKHPILIAVLPVFQHDYASTLFETILFIHINKIKHFLK